MRPKSDVKSVQPAAERVLAGLRPVSGISERGPRFDPCRVFRSAGRELGARRCPEIESRSLSGPAAERRSRPGRPRGCRAGAQGVKALRSGGAGGASPPP